MEEVRRGELPPEICLVVDSGSRFTKDIVVDGLKLCIQVFDLGHRLAFTQWGGDVLHAEDLVALYHSAYKVKNDLNDDDKRRDYFYEYVFLFSTYFTQVLAPSPEKGTALWGTATGIAGVIIAITSPFIGSIADHTGKRKPWLAFFTILCIVSTALMWFVEPNEDFILFALFLTIIGTIALEIGHVFYNTMLADLVPKDEIGKLSGQAWGLG